MTKELGPQSGSLQNTTILDQHRAAFEQNTRHRYGLHKIHYLFNREKEKEMDVTRISYFIVPGGVPLTVYPGNIIKR